MLFTDDFISKIPQDPLSSVLKIAKDTLNRIAEINVQHWSDEEYELLLEAVTLLRAIQDSDLHKMGVLIPSVQADLAASCQTMFNFLQTIVAEKTQDLAALRAAQMTAKFRNALGVQFAYEFSDGDMARIQGLITELREYISTASYFEEKHRSRLLARLEKLQSELHKRVSDLDKLWGLIGDAGVALGKFGTDAKPMVDRIREIADIVWNTQARAEELPSTTPLPLLPPLNHSHDSDADQS